MSAELSSDQRVFLESRFAGWVDKQLDAVRLRRILLQIDGLEVVAPPNNFESDLSLLISDGRVISGEVHLAIMADNSCHQNVTQLYSASSDPMLAIGTGFALNDGLWRQHSWIMDSRTITETTVEREISFGILLLKEDAERFCLLCT